jgi:hypothetical protein
VEKLKYLEFDKLIKELDFIQSEIKFKSELIRNIDSHFMESVSHFLKAHPHLKTVYDNQVNYNLSKNEKMTSKEENVEEKIIEDIEEIDDIRITDTNIRSLYRKIVKLTHPDKNGTQSLTHLYSEATEAYKSGKIYSIYKICHKLNLSVELTDEEIYQIKSEIKSEKERLNFLETTYPYQWWNENLESSKEKIILSYIKGQLIKE